METESRIKVAVERTGMGPTELAKHLGVKRSAIYQWLDGSTKPNPENYIRLSIKAGVRVQWLVFGEEPVESPPEPDEKTLILLDIIKNASEEDKDERLQEVIDFARFKLAG